MRSGVLYLALWAVACDAPAIGVAPADASSDAPPEDPAEFVRVAEAFCSMFAKCWPFELDANWGGYEQCMKRYPRYIARLTQGFGVTATPAQRAACAEAYDRTDCSRASRQWKELDVPGVCRIPGNLPAGAPCASRWQCQSFRCSGLCGVCTTVLGEGATCTGNEDCALGSICWGSKCIKPHDVGESCGATEVCHFDLACAADGKCVRAPKKGEPCLEGATWPCGGSTNRYCEATSKTCQLLFPAQLGQRCGQIDGWPRPCMHGHICKSLRPDEPGECIVAVPDGARCGSYHWTPAGGCIWPSICLGGACREPALADCSPPGIAP